MLIGSCGRTTLLSGSIRNSLQTRGPRVGSRVVVLSTTSQERRSGAVESYQVILTVPFKRLGKVPGDETYFSHDFEDNTPTPPLRCVEEEKAGGEQLERSHEKERIGGERR